MRQSLHKIDAEAAESAAGTRNNLASGMRTSVLMQKARQHLDAAMNTDDPAAARRHRESAKHYASMAERTLPDAG